MRLLGRAMLIEGEHSATGRWSIVEELGRTEARTLTERARRYFQLALDVNEGDTGGYGWLGRAEMLLGRPAAAVAAWQKGDFSTLQFIVKSGDVARQSKRYDEALRWYQYAAEIKPELGDPYYYIGLAYEGMERWIEALKAFQVANSEGYFVWAHRSSIYYHMGMIYQTRLSPQQLDESLSCFEKAIAIGDFGSVWEEAETYYRKGEALLLRKAEPSTIITTLQKALDLNPHHVWAHILLGNSYYIGYQDPEMAEAEIKQAIELSPQAKWAYFHLGEIYRQEGRVEEAQELYEKALEIDRGFEPAQNRLEELQIETTP